MERINWNKLEIIKEIIKESLTKSEVLEKIGLKNYGGNFNTLTSFISDNNIDISHFDIKTTKKSVVKTVYENIHDVLIKESPYKSTNNLKKRLYNEGIKARKCEECGQDENWRGKKFALILDHINGINNDNRLENLRILCPNCNATLETHCGKNSKTNRESNICDNIDCINEIKKESKICRDCYLDRGSKISSSKNECIDCKTHIKNYRSSRCKTCYDKVQRIALRPSNSILIKDIEELGYVGTGKKYGVSDNAIRKWIK